jgi:DNA processing protein
MSNISSMIKDTQKDKDKDIFKGIAISPYEEIIAYETLWAVDGMTEAKLSNLFKGTNDLPSSILANQFGQKLFKTPASVDIDDLRKRVKDLIDTKLGNFSVIINSDFQYPKELRQASHPSEILYYKGNLDLLSTKCVSIVGARKASEEGEKRARRLAKLLVDEGYTIVSGLAAGIDRNAHEAAIRGKGQTIAVIGTPVDQYYPKEHKDLQDYIAENHLLISQVPFYRYKNEHFKEHRYYFPRRNVTMASISLATVIVEASDTSGSLTQARACIQQGKQLFILESCFNVPGLKWPHSYEKKGAIRVKEFEDILKHLE